MGHRKLYDLPDGHYCLIDPDGRETFWVVRDRELRDYPPGRRWRPVPPQTPADVAREDRGAWLADWYATVYWPFKDAVAASIVADPLAAAWRFRDRLASGMVPQPRPRPKRVRRPRPGTPGALLRHLDELEGIARGKRWPTSPRGMTGALMRAAPAMRGIGWTIDRVRKNNAREWTITAPAVKLTSKQPSLPSQPSLGSSDQPKLGDGSSDGSGAGEAQPSPIQPTVTPTVTALTSENDGCDGGDGSSGSTLTGATPDHPNPVTICRKCGKWIDPAIRPGAARRIGRVDARERPGGHG